MPSEHHDIRIDPERDIDELFHRRELQAKRARSEARRRWWHAQLKRVLDCYRFIRLTFLWVGRQDRAVALVDAAFVAFIAVVVIVIVAAFVWGR